ncbi:Glucose dehydrogenase [acceptor] [Gryllus bimaculatus]|nr:Glucose dehydrogenase [acceptor] [Gryllus bimaculatus]
MINYFFTLIYWTAGVVISSWIVILGLSSLAFDFSCLQRDGLASEYDYVVVGAGSAGSIVARRLSEEAKVSVLLIEAGSSCSSWILDIPILSPFLQLSALDWQYQTVRQKHACYSLEGNASRWPRGKVVGGTSHLNYLMYVRGHKQDYDQWSEDGNAGWSYFDDALHYFRRSEKQSGRFKHDSYHSTVGPAVVSDIQHATPLADAFLKAAFELGYPIQDLNSQYQTGFMETQVHLHRGQRWNVDYAYIAQNNKNAVKLFCNAHVGKVLFQNDFEAVGVEGVHFGKKFSVLAKRAVILSAGTIGSPMILMRSGIGPKTHLILQNLPVGKNLQDHVTTGLDLIQLNQSLSIDFKNIASVSSFIQYMYQGKGPWSTTGCEAFGVIHSDLVDQRKELPDLQIMALPMGLTSDYGAHMRKAMGVKEEVWKEYFSPLKGSQVASIMPVLLHPKSRGEVKLKSQSIDDDPIIDPNYLEHEDDIKTLYEGIKIVKNLIKTEALQKLGAHLYEKKIPGCEDEKFDSPNYWLCYIKHLTLTSYHPVGTCKMGPQTDRTSVVDSNLRVHGTNKLFVVDASVMPSLPSGNVNAAVMMVAEKGADLVKEFWHQTVKKCNLWTLFQNTAMTNN